MLRVLYRAAHHSGPLCHGRVPCYVDVASRIATPIGQFGPSEPIFGFIGNCLPNFCIFFYDKCLFQEFVSKDLSSNI